MGFFYEEEPPLPNRVKDKIAALVWLLIAILLCIFAAVVNAEPPPRQPPPLGVPPTPKEIELGRALFFDPILSANGTVSCATCHDPKLGWSDGRRVAVGIFNQVGTRNSPTIINAGYVPLVFWDGRTVSTVAQALLPMSNPIEMGQQSEQQIVARLNSSANYVARFAETYGIDQQTGRAVTGQRLARAIAAFEATVTSFDAPIDRYRDGDQRALTPEARIGYGIFERSNCMDCHKPPLYTTNGFANNGSEFAGKPQITDQGRFSIASSGRGPDTVRAFKIPTLREIQRTAPYMHAGQFDTLERVVAHYNAGGTNFRNQRDRFTDGRIKPLGLTEEQADYLVTFLKEAFAGSDYPMIEAPAR
jgi:cytochrome c peroxidase